MFILESKNSSVFIGPLIGHVNILNSEGFILFEYEL